MINVHVCRIPGCRALVPEPMRVCCVCCVAGTTKRERRVFVASIVLSQTDKHDEQIEAALIQGAAKWVGKARTN